MYKLGIYHNGFGNCPNEYVQPHIEWCRNNIDGHWMIEPPHVTKNKKKHETEINLNYTFAFKEESDAMAFKLRWL